MVSSFPCHGVQDQCRLSISAPQCKSHFYREKERRRPEAGANSQRNVSIRLSYVDEDYFQIFWNRMSQTSSIVDCSQFVGTFPTHSEHEKRGREEER